MTEHLVLADVPLPRAADDIRRYCGVPWSGGLPEVWAYHYFDAHPSVSNDLVTPPDVLATAALHSGLTHRDLTYFAQQTDRLADQLRTLSSELDLATATPAVLDAVASLGELATDSGIGLALLTKVFHRKRPRLVPIAERAFSELYAGRIGAQGVAAWPRLVRALSKDLSAAGNLRMLAKLQTDLQAELPVVPSRLRLADIAIWMEARR
ncbi:MAG: DUF6308 family protein [Mycobacteriales bacterium]